MHESEINKKQLQTYLRPTGIELGNLLNTGEALIRDGNTRIIHGNL